MELPSLLSCCRLTPLPDPPPLETPHFSPDVCRSRLIPELLILHRSTVLISFGLSLLLPLPLRRPFTNFNVRSCGSWSDEPRSGGFHRSTDHLIQASFVFTFPHLKQRERWCPRVPGPLFTEAFRFLFSSRCRKKQLNCVAFSSISDLR